MKKFDTLVEKWLDSEKRTPMWGDTEYIMDVFINPTMKELNECGEGCRGVVDGKGNLYVGKVNKGGVIHVDLIDFLTSRGDLPLGRPGMLFGGDVKKGFTVQRWKKSNGFYLGEGFYVEDWEDIFEPFKKVVKNFMKKNPGLEITADNIKYHHYDKQFYTSDWS